MTHRIKLLTLIAPAALLAGCTGDYRGVESVHQPVVSRTDFVFDLQAAGYGLASGEPARLAGWLASLHVGYGDTVTIDDPSGQAGGARQEVAAQIAGRGLMLGETAPITAGPVAPGAVRVVVSRATAGVPSCPDYHGDVSGYVNFDAHTSSNYGCGTNTTLARMIANPIDLVRGQPGAVALDPATGARAIQAYRDAKPTGGGGTTLQAQSTGGK